MLNLPFWGVKNSFCLSSLLQNAQQPASSQQPGQYLAPQPSVSTGATPPQTVSQTQTSQVMPMPQAAAGTQVSSIFLSSRRSVFTAGKLNMLLLSLLLSSLNSSKTFIQIVVFLVYYNCRFGWKICIGNFLSHMAVMNNLFEGGIVLPCSKIFKLSKISWGILMNGVLWMHFQELVISLLPIECTSSAPLCV